MLKQGRQEQEREVVYDIGEQMQCPYSKKEIEKKGKCEESIPRARENALQ